MALWFLTDNNMVINGDRVRALYEKAGCDDPEDQGVYAVLDYEWKQGNRTVRLKTTTLNDLMEWIDERDDQLVLGNVKTLDPVDV